MTVKELAEKNGWRLLSGKSGENNEAVSCYAGDLLSWVMARAGEGDVWLTVMGNINAIAVAALTEAAAVVLTENAGLDDNAREKSEQQGIPVYQTEENTYITAVKIHESLKA